MARFRFRLDPVLGVRERAERERAGEHARKLAAQLQEEQRRDDLITRRDALRDQLMRDHNRWDADTLRMTYAHLAYLDRVIVEAYDRVAAAALETDAARERLVAAAKERKVLETLKERRKEAFMLEAALVEQRELDDQNARGYDRAHPLEGLPS